VPGPQAGPRSWVIGVLVLLLVVLLLLLLVRRPIGGAMGDGRSSPGVCHCNCYCLELRRGNGGGGKALRSYGRPRRGLARGLPGTCGEARSLGAWVWSA